MTIMVGNAVHDENGRSRGGKKGDQMQKNTPDYSGEVRQQPFYVNKKGWYILRWKDPNLSMKAASLMKIACDNPNIGYSQTIDAGKSGREAIFTDHVDSTKPTNCDCSTLVNEVIRGASGLMVPNFNTENEVSVLGKTGLFQNPVKWEKGFTLYTGDVLVTCTKGHTLIITEGMPWTNPFVKPNSNVTSYANAKKQGCKNYIRKGEAVQWVQYQLCQKGYQSKIDNAGGIDGVCGSATVECIIEYQAANGLDPDGIAGPKTIKKLEGK